MDKIENELSDAHMFVLQENAYWFHNWIIEKACIPFNCTHPNCLEKRKINALVVVYLNEDGPQNYCLKHGLAKFKRFKSGFDLFEIVVEQLVKKSS